MFHGRLACTVWPMVYHLGKADSETTLFCSPEYFLQHTTFHVAPHSIYIVSVCPEWAPLLNSRTFNQSNLSNRTCPVTIPRVLRIATSAYDYYFSYAALPFLNLGQRCLPRLLYHACWSRATREPPTLHTEDEKIGRQSISVECRGSDKTLPMSSLISFENRI